MQKHFHQCNNNLLRLPSHYYSTALILLCVFVINLFVARRAQFDYHSLIVSCPLQIETDTPRRRFIIMRQLGKGGCGDVYLAKELESRNSHLSSTHPHYAALKFVKVRFFKARSKFYANASGHT